MSTDTFTIKKAFQLSAITKGGARVYYDTDSHSGGYPYWSTWHNNVTFNTLDKIPTFGPTDYMRNDIVRIEVLELTIKAKIVSSTELVSDARARAMAEIDKIQKDLAHKIAVLELTK